MTFINKAIKASLLCIALGFAAPASAQVVTDIFLLVSPTETGKSVSYEQLQTLDPSTFLEVTWSNGVITQVTTAELLEWYASQE